MRVLIIKLTSMGDLMHAFPALTDAQKKIPGISFDWVVDEGFAEVPQWHPAVHNIITTAHRRWKKNIVSSWRKGEFSEFYQQLNCDDYDVIVDLQSNLKSAFVSWLRRGPIHGYDKKTCREKPAHWAYTTQHSIPLRQHAIERQRALFAKIFNYDQPNSPSDYGVDLHQYPLPIVSPSEQPLPEKYVVFIHNASWPTKLWPIGHWQALIEKVSAVGYSILLPCGSDVEYKRAQSIAQYSPMAIALEKMGLQALAAIISHAQAAVCSDTGLAH
jgi:heptosyltransferase-1